MATGVAHEFGFTGVTVSQNNARVEQPFNVVGKTTGIEPKVEEQIKGQSTEQEKTQEQERGKYHGKEQKQKQQTIKVVQGKNPEEEQEKQESKGTEVAGVLKADGLNNISGIFGKKDKKELDSIKEGLSEGEIASPQDKGKSTQQQQSVEIPGISK